MKILNKSLLSLIILLFISNTIAVATENVSLCNVRDLFDCSMKIIDSSNNVKIKVVTLNMLSWSLFRAGQKEKAKNILDLIDSLIKSNNKIKSDDVILSEVIDSYIKLGQKEKALEYLSWVSNISDFGFSKKERLNNLVILYLKLNQDEKAYEIVNNEKDPELKVGMLSNMANFYTQKGDKNKTNQLLSEIHKLISNIDDKQKKAISLAYLSKSYIELGEINKAKQYLSEALELSNSIKDNVLAFNIAEIFAEIGEFEKAFSIIESSDSKGFFSLIKSNYIDQIKSLQAYKYINDNKLNEAKATIDTIKDETIKVSALLDLSKAYYKKDKRSALALIEEAFNVIYKTEDIFLSDILCFNLISYYLSIDDYAGVIKTFSYISDYNEALLSFINVTCNIIGKQQLLDDNKIEFLNKLLRLLYAKKNKPYIGVTIGDLTEEMKKVMRIGDIAGVMITQVNDNSPAEESGLQFGDIIIQINDEKVFSIKDVLRIVRSYPAGSIINFTILRKGQKLVIPIKTTIFRNEE